MTIEQLAAEKQRLDEQIASGKALGLGISRELACAWWDAAAALRDAMLAFPANNTLH